MRQLRQFVKDARQTWRMAWHLDSLDGVRFVGLALPDGTPGQVNSWHREEWICLTAPSASLAQPSGG